MKLLFLLILYAIALSAALAKRGFRPRGASAGKVGGKRSLGFPPFQSGQVARDFQQAPKRLLIVGATGETGRQLVAQALERGYAVTALVRQIPGVPE